MAGHVSTLNIYIDLNIVLAYKEVTYANGKWIWKIWVLVR